MQDHNLLPMTSSGHDDAVRYVELDAADTLRLRALVLELSRIFNQRAEADLALSSRLLAERLPASVKEAVLRFVDEDDSAALLLRSFGDLSSQCGDSPSELDAHHLVTNPGQIALALVLALTGRLVAYRSQQDGRIFNDVVPLPRHLNDGNSSAGSRLDFQFHTEDAYHDHPPDYLGLFCVRNPERAETMLGWLPKGGVPATVFESLNQPAFVIAPNRGSIHAPIEPRARPLLFGDPDWPYMQLNFANPPVIVEQKQRNALEWVHATLERNSTSIVLNPGDLLIVNNLRAVHGRRGFITDYGSTRRWLIRGLTRPDARRLPRQRGAGAYPFTL